MNVNYMCIWFLYNYIFFKCNGRHLHDSVIILINACRNYPSEPVQPKHSTL